MRGRFAQGSALLAVGAAIVVVLAGCDFVGYGGLARDVGRVSPVRTDTSAPLLSNRDVGASTRLTGTDSVTLETKTRDLWVFGDSDGWDATTGVKFSGLGFATNTGSLVDPDNGEQDLPAAVTTNSSGTRFTSLISGVAGGCDTGYYSARWPKSVVRLPDTSTRYETALVFYQDVCANLTTGNFVLKKGGIAKVTWDANDADHAPSATIIASGLFDVATWYSNYSGQTVPGGTYGAAPLLTSLGNGNWDLSVLACGPASDCTSAHVTINEASNTADVVDITKWSYRSDGPTTADTDDVWVPLVAGCVPPSTTSTSCSLPLAKAVVKASSDRLTQVWGSPSVAVIPGYPTMLGYTPGPDVGAAGLSPDHGALRVMDANGIYMAPNRVDMPAAHCGPSSDAARGCYAFAIHPDIPNGYAIRFSYVAQKDEPIPNDPNNAKINHMRLAEMCFEEFFNAACGSSH